MFIFDVNSEYKHQCVLADNVFVIEDDNIYCVWQNSQDEMYTDISLDFFVKSDNGYDRYTEEFSERCYTDKELVEFGNNSGLKTEAIFDDMSHSSPNDFCERKIFVMRKI